MKLLSIIILLALSAQAVAQSNCTTYVYDGKTVVCCRTGDTVVCI